MYIYDVDDMCTIVLRRISYNGIFVANHSICPEAPIHSDYAATLRELYEYYPLMSNGYVQVPMKSFADAQYQVHARCSHEWNFAQYVDELFPMFEFEECFTHPGSVDAGTYYDSPCEPVKEVYVGNVSDLVIVGPALQACLHALDVLDEKRAAFTDAQLFHANLPGIIGPEKARAWTEFMPTWLQQHATRPLV